MACPKCGAPTLLDTDTPCINCVVLPPVNDYEYDVYNDEVTCGNCKETTGMADSHTLVEGDETLLLWKCPHCNTVYDLGE